MSPEGAQDPDRFRHPVPERHALAWFERDEHRVSGLQFHPFAVQYTVRADELDVMSARIEIEPLRTRLDLVEPQLRDAVDANRDRVPTVRRWPSRETIEPAVHDNPGRAGVGAFESPEVARLTARDVHEAVLDFRPGRRSRPAHRSPPAWDGFRQHRGPLSHHLSSIDHPRVRPIETHDRRETISSHASRDNFVMPRAISSHARELLGQRRRTQGEDRRDEHHRGVDTTIPVVRRDLVARSGGLTTRGRTRTATSRVWRPAHLRPRRFRRAR